jgi:threonine dehydratase
MPAAAPLVKVERCRKLGAEITLVETLSAALDQAKSLAVEKGLTLVPPFDHPNIIAGQGVAALEILEQASDVDSIIVPIGGGGYSAGIATVIKAKRPDIFILGVCSEWAMQVRTNPLLHQKKFVPSSIADGIAVKTIGSITGPIIDKLVDKVVSVSETTIARAIISLLEFEHAVVEGAGAAAFAALREGLLPDHCKKPVVMVCGSNIDMNLLSRLIELNMAERGRLLRVSIALPDRPGSLNAVTTLVAAEGANILQVLHDRFYARLPGNVEITVVMEVRDRTHADTIVQRLIDSGMQTWRV